MVTTGLFDFGFDKRDYVSEEDYERISNQKKRWVVFRGRLPDEAIYYADGRWVRDPNDPRVRVFEANNAEIDGIAKNIGGRPLRVM